VASVLQLARRVEHTHERGVERGSVGLLRVEPEPVRVVLRDRHEPERVADIGARRREPRASRSELRRDGGVRRTALRDPRPEGAWRPREHESLDQFTVPPDEATEHERRGVDARNGGKRSDLRRARATALLLDHDLVAAAPARLDVARRRAQRPRHARPERQHDGADDRDH
jgi:hypothetical protein